MWRNWYLRCRDIASIKRCLILWPFTVYYGKSGVTLREIWREVTRTVWRPPCCRGSRAGGEKTSSAKVQATRLRPQLLLQRTRLGWGGYNLGKEIAQVHGCFSSPRFWKRGSPGRRAENGSGRGRR